MTKLTETQTNTNPVSLGVLSIDEEMLNVKMSMLFDTMGSLAGKDFDAMLLKFSEVISRANKAGMNIVDSADLFCYFSRVITMFSLHYDLIAHASEFYTKKIEWQEDNDGGAESC